jgi:hypothetical protein
MGSRGHGTWPHAWCGMAAPVAQPQAHSRHTDRLTGAGGAVGSEQEAAAWGSQQYMCMYDFLCVCAHNAVYSLEPCLHFFSL